MEHKSCFSTKTCHKFMISSMQNQAFLMARVDWNLFYGCNLPNSELRNRGIRDQRIMESQGSELRITKLRRRYKLWNTNFWNFVKWNFNKLLRFWFPIVLQCLQRYPGRNFTLLIKVKYSTSSIIRTSIIRTSIIRTPKVFIKNFFCPLVLEKPIEIFVVCSNCCPIWKSYPTEAQK